MAELRDLEYHRSRPNIDKLIRSILIRHLMSIRCPFLNEYLQRIDTINQLLGPTHMTRRCHNLPLSRTLVTLLLELLHKARRNLLLGNYHSLAVALGAGFHIFWVVTAAATAVGADDLAVVRDVEGFADVKFFKG